ncbi:hypothetical protein [Rufibacter hautae]|uniref:Uncharacterized protein n=1 Tax=Rufibacter hautae TaxID=2595005 RepID=A0A5B6TIG2_9BACT|nr:hypothetical protein [Rufibacter hautae]KAA3439237.1 hypothetical protein FOA19_00700 [Rufibacter hautae]
MKKFKKIVLDVIPMVAVIAVSTASDKYPFVFKALICLWAAWFLYTTLNNLLYRVGVKENEIRYHTINDNYHKYFQIGIGIALTVLSICTWLWITTRKDFAPIGVVIGLLLIVAGLLELPRGEMKLRTDSLILSGVPDEIGKDALTGIVIEEDRITLTHTRGEVVSQEMLRLDPKTATAIEQFLVVRIGCGEIIKNNVG